MNRSDRSRLNVGHCVCGPSRTKPRKTEPSRAELGWAVLLLQPGRRHGDGVEEEKEEEEVQDNDEAVLLQERLVLQ